MTSTRIFTIAAVCAALTMGAVVGGNSFISHYSAAASEARAARAETAVAVARSTSALKFAADSRDEANALDKQLSLAVSRAAASERKSQHLRLAFDSAAHTAPDTCRVLVSTASAVMVQQDSTIADLRVAVQTAQESKAIVETALDSTQAALVALRAASITLSHADANLAKHARPSFFVRILPHPGLGATVGFDATGVPRAVVGITIGWSF